MCELKFSFFIAKQGDERRLFIVPDTFIFVAQQGGHDEFGDHAFADLDFYSPPASSPRATTEGV